MLMVKQHTQEYYDHSGECELDTPIINTGERQVQ